MDDAFLFGRVCSRVVCIEANQFFNMTLFGNFPHFEWILETLNSFR